MVSVAEKWFQFSVSKTMNVVVKDGIQFIKEACNAGKKGD